MQLNYARVRLYDLLGEVEAVSKEIANNPQATGLEVCKADTLACNARLARPFWRIPAATEKPPVRTANETPANDGQVSEND